jgi:hypothetical protein
MENSRRPEIGAFAATLFAICEEPPIFSDLDVLREEDLRGGSAPGRPSMVRST